MMENYTVSNKDWDEADKSGVADAVDVSERGGQEATTEVTEAGDLTEVAEAEDELDETVHYEARAAAEEHAEKLWFLPEKNLPYVALILNLSLLYARASSTSILAFWHLVVFANLGMFLCLVQEPDWRSILEQVRACPPNNPVLQALQKSFKKSEKAKSLKAVKHRPKKPSYIPVAGCTAVKLKNPTDPPANDKGEMFAGWRTVPGESLMVRSHGYLDTKKKVSSPGELYECVNIDIFESPHRYPDMAKRVKLPACEFDDGGAPKTWHTPDIFIISIALPTDPPKLGRTSSDGGGYTITMYYKMKQSTRDILRRVTAAGYDPSKEKVGDVQKSQVNAVRLLEEWVRRAPTDQKFFSRFKVVPNAHNLKEIGMPNWIAKYNGKPFLIKRPGETGFLFSHPELSCLEFDISLHVFPYLAKQAICFMKDSYFKKVLVSFGFVIEGRSDDEVRCALVMSVIL
jgi:hypothetical protein